MVMNITIDYQKRLKYTKYIYKINMILIIKIDRRLNNMSQLFQSTFQTLTMDEAKIEIEDNPNIIIVDVRTPEEYKKGHIPGAMNIPVETPQLITEKIPDKNETIFVYCLSGGRSQRASELFADMGYGHITDIGGILFWPGNLEKGE